jgi:hypothetical protein
MGLNSSGPISLAGTTAGVSIEIENGGNGTTQISLNDTAVRSLAGVPSGAITMPTDFYGKSNAFSLNITSDQVNASLRSLAISAGWNQTTNLVATISSGVYVYSNSTGTPGLTVSGSFPGGVSLINNGYITGMGGDGSAGANATGGNASNGASGGLALSVSSAISITNNNIIAGGGGGGGGGGSLSEQGGGGKAPYYPSYGWAGGGGGGGQTGLSNSSGGSAGGGNFSQRSRNPAPGGSGTNSSAGSGGQGGAAPNSSYYAGAGGSGGSWGSAGARGQDARSYSYNWTPGNGGSAGAAVTGNSNITWVNTGTRYGGIS